MKRLEHDLLLVRGEGGVVVEALGLQHLRQLPSPPLRLLELGPLILEPDLDLALLETQLR